MGRSSRLGLVPPHLRLVPRIGAIRRRGAAAAASISTRRSLARHLGNRLACFGGWDGIVARSQRGDKGAVALVGSSDAANGDDGQFGMALHRTAGTKPEYQSKSGPSLGNRPAALRTEHLRKVHARVATRGPINRVNAAGWDINATRW
jgi:hypothetical protein